ncbi:EFR1 family ferrodoxin [Beduini massiliensis]|uniref:EFR1 family ferrodoxin n=1 Tax=Beduini massiliensis TaxID=1585974 RepID=UPI00059A9BDD|nr:EFR1 family ferrodoxin [Beduini massiliensis]
MIFYFSATGNCLHISQQLDSHSQSIPQVLKTEDLEFEDETIGIVTPVYAGKMPHIVRRFIEKATFKTNYFYIISTYGMNDSVASEWASQFCKEQGIKVNYANTLQMVDNYLPSFDVNEQKAMDKKIPEQLSMIKEDLNQRKNFIKQPTEDGREKYDLVKARFTEYPEINNGEQIKITDKCSGCGICVRVCPIGNIKIIGGKAVKINKTCEFCLACANNCPSKAIIMSISDKNPNARYRNEHVSLQDIIKANEQ